MVLKLCCYSKNKNRRKTTYQFEVSYKNEAGSNQDYLEPLPTSNTTQTHAVVEENAWDFSGVRVRHSRSLEDTVSKGNPRTPSFLKYKYRKLQELDNTASDLDGSSSNLRNYLGKRLQKVDGQRIPRTFSDNVYQNVTPAIVETPRRFKNGRDYVFVSAHEFRELERSGKLREKLYEGNYYGESRTTRGFSEPLKTDARPKPAKRTNVGRIGQMDTMSKQSMVDHLDEHQNPQPSHDDTLSSRSRSPGEAPSYRHDSSHLQPTEEELGPLPTNWEKAYTERGEVYFIDHNSGTSQWLDPRLARLQKKSLEECSDDELPYGWEKIDDPHYGVYYIDHVNRKTQYENPVLQAKRLAMNNNGGGSISDSGSSTFPRAKKSQMDMPSGMTEQPGDQTQPKRASSDSTLKRNKKARDNYQRSFFTRNPSELQGEKIVTRLVKSTRGLGFTIVGGDDSDDEFLQIKSVVPNGPAWLDGKLRTGDVIVYVNDVCVLGFTHHDMVSMFQRISPGEAVTLEVCRGYPLSFDLNDPNTEIVTTVAVSADPYVEEQGHNQPRPVSALRDEGHMGWSENGRVSKSIPEMMGKQESRSRPNSRPGSADILHGQEPEEDLNVSTGSVQPIEYLTVRINKGDLGFGFTIADSANGQKVKKILDRPRCKNLQEGDILIDINGIDMRALSHSEVVQLLKDCPKGQDATITVQRGGVNSPRKNKWKKSKDDTSLNKKPLFSFAGLYRSKTPTADLYSAQTKEVVPTRPKTPLVDTRQRSKTPNEYENRTSVPRELSRTPVGDLANQFSSVHLDEDPYSRTKQRSKSPGRELEQPYQNGYDEYNQRSRPPPPPKPLNTRQYQPEPAYYQQEYYEDDIGPGQLVRQDSGYGTQFGSSGYYGGPTGYQTEWRQDQQLDRRDNYPAEYPPRQPGQPPQRNGVQIPSDYVEMTVTLLRQESGFGFRIVGGTEEGSQVSIGHIVPGGSADMDGRLRTGDEILNVDGINVVHSSHHHVVQLMGAAASRGRVTIGVRRRMEPPVDNKGDMVTYPYDVTVTRRETEGFGFVIISSVTKAVSFIGQIIRGSPAERCERLHVGDRILAVNHVNIEHLNHGDIVSLIKDSGYSVTLTVGPPIDDTSSNTTAASQQSSQGSMVMAQAVPTIPGELSQQHIPYDQGYTMNEIGPPYGKRDMMPPSGQYLEDSVDGRTMDSDISSYFTVELQRGPRGFGFSIRGGREFHSMPLFVLRIADHGPAAEDGRLQVGDQLIEINGINTSEMAHSEAIEVIKNGGPTVRLLVRRGTKMPPGIADMEPMTQLSPITPGSTNISGYSDGRPGSSMSQPHLAPAYSTPNESTQSYQHWQGSLSQNGPVHMHQQSHVAPSTNQYVPLRPGAPPPLLVQPSGRHYPMQNGPLSHSSPRITTATDYYWERYPEVRQ